MTCTGDGSNGGKNWSIGAMFSLSSISVGKEGECGVADGGGVVDGQCGVVGIKLCGGGAIVKDDMSSLRMIIW